MNRRVLITGATGFLGQWLVKALKLTHNEVFVSNGRDCDLRNEAAAQALVANVWPDVVIHAAAKVGGIGANRAAPAEFLRDNLLMNLNVMEACRLAKVKKVVTIGSTCAYPKYAPAPFCEADLWNGYPEETNAPYGISKRALLMLCRTYREQYGLNAIHLIPTNMYGPLDNFDLQTSHVIPALIRKTDEATKTGLPLQVWGTGAATRDFLYVVDAATAVVTAMTHYDEAEPINLGSGRDVSIATLVAMIADLMGFDGEIEWLTDMPDGQPVRRLDISRAQSLLGWKASTDLRDGLWETIQWYKRTSR